MSTAANTSIYLRAPLDLRPAGVTKLPSRFTGTAYSGGYVASYGCVIDLASTSVPPKMPLLADHIRNEIIGTVDRANVERGQISVEGKLFSDMAGSEAERIANLSARGAPFQMSVGVYNFTEEVIPAGQSISVNGRDFTGPITVLRRGMVRECSVVTLGADPAADAQFFHEPAKRETEIASLFAALGETPTPAQRAAFRTLSPAAFSAFSLQLLTMRVRQLAPVAAENQDTQGAQLNASEHYAKRRAQTEKLSDGGAKKSDNKTGKELWKEMDRTPCDIYERRRRDALRGAKK